MITGCVRTSRASTAASSTPPPTRRTTARTGGTASPSPASSTARSDYSALALVRLWTPYLHLHIKTVLSPNPDGINDIHVSGSGLATMTTSSDPSHRYPRVPIGGPPVLILISRPVIGCSVRGTVVTMEAIVVLMEAVLKLPQTRI